MLTNELITTIENDTSGSKECPVEENAVKALERLKNEGKFSDAELQQLYSTELKQYLGTIDSDNAMLYKVQKLNAITGKLLKTRLEQNKESHDSSWFKNIIYGCIGVDKKIEANTTGKNIAKGVIDEFASIPEMMGEIVKHPIDFGKGLYVALVQNFSQTMSAIKNSYTDAFQGAETPEKAYKTGRSAANIILTLIPGKIGASLLRVGKLGAKIGKGAGKLGSKIAKGTGEALKTHLPKTINNLSPVVSTTRTSLSKLKTNVTKSKPVTSVVNKSKTVAQKAENIAQKTKEAGKRAMNTKLVQSTAEILTIPVVFGKYAGKKLFNLIPSRLQPAIIKQYQAVAFARLEVARLEALVKRQPNHWAMKKGLDAKKAALESAQLAFKKSMIGVGVIGLHEVDNVMKSIASSNIEKNIQDIMTDEVSRDTLENVSVDSGVNTFDANCLDIPQLEYVSDRSKINITITGLSSWTGTREKNLALAEQRAKNAEDLLRQQYAIPADFTNFSLQTYRQETPVEGKQPKDFQGVKIQIDEGGDSQGYANEAAAEASEEVSS